MPTEHGGQATVATTCARSPSASKSTRKLRIMGSKSELLRTLQAQKRRVLACPVLYRSGAPEEIRTPDSQPRPLTRTAGPLRREPGEPVKPEGIGRRALWVERQVRHHRADGAREYHSVRCATRLKPGPRRLVSEAG